MRLFVPFSLAAMAVAGQLESESNQLNLQRERRVAEALAKVLYYSLELN